MSDKDETIEGHVGVLANMTDEQFENVKKKTAALVAKDQRLNLTMAVLIAAQQLYALARLAAQRELASEGYKWDDGIEEMMLQSSRAKANEPMTREDVFNNIRERAIVFLAEEIQIESADAQFDRLEKLATVAPIQVTELDDGRGTAVSELKRGQVLVHYSGREALFAKLILEDLQIPKSGRKPCVLHLMAETSPQELTSKSDKPRYAKVGLNSWMHACESRAGLHKLLNTHRDRLHKKRCDVLLVEHVSHGFRQVAPTLDNYEQRVIETIKQLRRWCEENSTALVVTIPQKPALDTILAPGVHMRESFRKELTEHYTLHEGAEYT